MTLCYLDECGVAPSQPVTSSWVERGRRKRVAYENPEPRRVNVLAAVVPDGGRHSLTWVRYWGSISAAQFLAFLPSIPHPADQPLVVVLDNGSIHRSRLVKEARAGLWRQGIYLYFLPPYSPELNRIERVFRVIKHQGIPERTHRTYDALEDAVQATFLANNFSLRTYDGTELNPGLAA